MTKITEAARNFSESAKEQRQATEKAVRSEFQRLSSVIKQESKNAAQISKDAIQRQSWKASAWQTFNVMPIIAAFALGVGLTLILASQERYQIVAVEVNEQGTWTYCEVISDNQRWCMIEEAD